MAFSQWKKGLIEWSKSILIAVVIALLISIFIVQPHIVSGSSMEPTFQGVHAYNQEMVGDRVIIFKSPYLIGNGPQYNDMIIIDSNLQRKRTLKNDILDSPLIKFITTEEQNETELWIKRVVGLAGDTIQFKDQQLYRNDILLEEEYIKENMNQADFTIIIPDGHIYVLGDNRNRSRDSRDIGPIPEENIVGKVFLRYYPFHKISTY